MDTIIAEKPQKQVPTKDVKPWDFNPPHFRFLEPIFLYPPTKRLASATGVWYWSNLVMDTEMRDVNMLASMIELKLMREAETTLGANRIEISDAFIQWAISGKIIRPFPYLIMATIADIDFRNLPDMIAEGMFRKCYALADKWGINSQNPFDNDPESWLAESKGYKTSLCEHLGYLQLNCTAVRGQHEETLENIQFFTDIFGGRSLVLPVRTVVNTSNTIVPLYLPGKEHLIGLNQMPDQGIICLTPDYQEQLINPQSVSWVGDYAAVEADSVDWSPLFNRSIIYAVNPVSFGNDAKRCLSCMEMVCSKLSDNGCRVKLLVRQTAKLIDFEDRAQVYKAYNVPIPEGVTDWEKSLSEVRTAEFPVYLVNKLLYHRDISILYAEAGIGKSWFIDSVAAAVRCGSGISERFSVDKPASTLVINGEMRQDELNKRGAVLDKLYPHGASKSFFKSLRAPLPLDTPEGQAWLQEATRQCNRHNSDCAPISLVILDSLKTLTSDGENKKNWGSLFQLLEQMRTERDITFVIIQHENKDGKIYGTIDQNVKINGEFRLTRDVNDITPTDPSDKFRTPKKYREFLLAKLMAWREEHPDDIWFFLIPPKGRSMKPQDKRPVMLHFLPEADHPVWHCIDFLVQDHPWSLRAFRGADGCVGETMSMPSGEKPLEDADAIPSYKALLDMQKASVVQWLQKAQAQSGKSREAWGRYFGVHKDQIDYLMKKKDLQKSDITPVK